MRVKLSLCQYFVCAASKRAIDFMRKTLCFIVGRAKEDKDREKGETCLTSALVRLSLARTVP